VLAFVFFYEGVRVLGAAAAAAIAFLVPIFGVLALVLGERAASDTRARRHDRPRWPLAYANAAERRGGC